MRRWIDTIFSILSRPYAVFEEAAGGGEIAAATATFLAALILAGLSWVLALGWLTPVVAFTTWILPALTYPVAVAAIFAVSRLWVRENRLRSFFAVWGFSYLPTGCLFLMVNLGRFLLDLPQFNAVSGAGWIQLIVWMVAILMFLWKLLLLATTLRVAGNLNFTQIIWAMLILLVAAAGYWWGGMTLGWLKVPFI
jgi:small-conductance mechanosensitive channel